MVETRRFELLTPCLQGRCSPNWAMPPSLSIDILRITALNFLSLVSHIANKYAPSLLTCLPCTTCIWIKIFFDCILYNQNCISSLFKNILSIAYFWKYFLIRLSPRPISTSQLHTLLHFHSLPIYHLFLMGSYYLRMGYLILRLASCLDAFSTYLIRT